MYSLIFQNVLMYHCWCYCLTQKNCRRMKNMIDFFSTKFAYFKDMCYLCNYEKERFTNRL